MGFLQLPLLWPYVPFLHTVACHRIQSDFLNLNRLTDVFRNVFHHLFISLVWIPNIIHWSGLESLHVDICPSDCDFFKGIHPVSGTGHLPPPGHSPRRRRRDIVVP